jgi:HAD superfamily hydrolase (TIGR01509 family)
MKPEAIYFDLYETLITEWKENQKKATYSIEALGIDENTYKREWAARGERRMNGTFTDHQSVLRDILTTLGKPIDEHAIDAIHQQRLMAKLIPFQEVDREVIQMLKTLREMKIKIGLISNCTPEEVIGFNDSDLADLFDDIIFSYKVKQAKPNAEIYWTACNRLNVSPDNSLFIVDGGSNELVGATNVGMKAYQATWFLPKHISDRIIEFPKLLKPMQVLELI